MTHNETNTGYDMQQLLRVFEWMPMPALVTDTEGKLLAANPPAMGFFGMKDGQPADGSIHAGHFFVDFAKAFPLILDSAAKNETLPGKYLVRLPGRQLTCIDLHARLLPYNNTVLIQFTESAPKARLIFSEMTHTYRREVSRLKPYLNKAGKELLDEIVANIAHGNTSNSRTAAGVDYTDTLRKERHSYIGGIFPQLTGSELTLGSFLSMNMPINEIAAFTGKSSNCLRVTLHRILKKTNCASTKEFLQKIER